MKLSTLSSRNIAIQIFIMTIGMLIFGLIMIYSASVTEAIHISGDKFFFVKQQLRWAIVGMVSLLILSRISLHTIQKLSPTLIITGLTLLILVLIPGFGLKLHGARRWLAIPFFTLQPSELMKLIQIIYLSSFLTSKRVELVQFLVFIAFVSFLILLQPDMGTTLVIVTSAIAVYFLAGYPIKHILSLGVVGIALVSILVIASPYRRSRLTTFLNPMHDPLGSSYHIRQILLAFGSGGTSGVGFGKSRQKHDYLPEATTDSIFAVIGEELGFIGSSIVILALLYFIYLGFEVSARATTNFSKVLSGGITAWFAIQVVLNLSSMVALTPLTGIPLPLISYGGSALITMLSGIGILINIARNN